MITTQVEIASSPSDVRKVVRFLPIFPPSIWHGLSVSFTKYSRDLSYAAATQFLDFQSLPSWHSGFLKSISPLSEFGPLCPSQKIHCEFEEFAFDAEITENTPAKFQWRGPPVKGVSGIHSFIFEESKITPGGTTFKQTEEFFGIPVFLMRSWLLGQSIKEGFENFNADLKVKVEGEFST